MTGCSCGFVAEPDDVLAARAVCETMAASPCSARRLTGRWAGRHYCDSRSSCWWGGGNANRSGLLSAAVCSKCMPE
ncbi:hypothetical protein BPORC_1830 [Bifidobacterium porcinum]|nr:hypothetical protein BPORC_1830 [Bifidobacterium porcinum]